MNLFAWATLPPDGAHEPVWGRSHIVDGPVGGGARTLCGKTAPVPGDLHDWDYGDEAETCLVCQRVLDCRRKRAETS